MAKIVLVCLRSAEPARLKALRAQMGGFLESLRPDNLPEARILVNEDGQGLLLGIFNPFDETTTRGCSAYAGWLADEAQDWSQEGAAAPEGTYALFRGHARRVELLADFIGSRTIWIAQTPELFVASTSQRAIPWFTGRFEMNPRAMLWMLSSGTLGPGEAWDRRARPLGPAGVARLDRDSWQLEVREPAIELRPDLLDEAEHAARLRRAFTENFAKLRFDWNQWVMPLSGGHDSRSLLLWMPDRTGLQTLTWGTTEALHRRGSDAWVARRVAQFAGVEHRYCLLEPGDASMEQVINRFLLAGEGRIDHLGAYMDGFQLWAKLAADGMKGIVRGDHPFGLKRIGHADGARLRTGLACWSDYKNLPSLQDLRLQHLEPQAITAPLQRKPGEAAPDWRDRLYHAFRVPTVLGALNELKAAYVEVANPLLLRPFVMLARAHPAPLRTGKRLFRQVSRDRRLPIDYATMKASDTPESLFKRSDLAELVLDEISSRRVRELLSPELSRYLARHGLEAPRRSWRASGVARSLKSWLPDSLLAKVKGGPRFRTLSTQRLALRAFFISRMDESLRRDTLARPKLA